MRRCLTGPDPAPYHELGIDVVENPGAFADPAYWPYVHVKTATVWRMTDIRDVDPGTSEVGPDAYAEGRAASRTSR